MLRIAPVADVDIGDPPAHCAHKGKRVAARVHGLLDIQRKANGLKGRRGLKNALRRGELAPEHIFPADDHAALSGLLAHRPERVEIALKIPRHRGEPRAAQAVIDVGVRAQRLSGIQHAPEHVKGIGALARGGGGHRRFKMEAHRVHARAAQGAKALAHHLRKGGLVFAARLQKRFRAVERQA